MIEFIVGMVLGFVAPFVLNALARLIPKGNEERYAPPGIAEEKAGEKPAKEPRPKKRRTMWG